MNVRIINVLSAVIAAGVAVGAISVHDCGSSNEIDLQSPSLIGPNAMSFNTGAYEEPETVETGSVPFSYGNPSVKLDDYTIVLMASYTDIAAEYGSNPADTPTYDGNVNWIKANTTLLSPKDDSADKKSEGKEVKLKIGDKLVRISYTSEWSLVKLSDGTQGYVKNSVLSDTLITPVPTATPTPKPTPKPKPKPSGSSGSGKSGESSCDMTVYASCALNTRSGPGISYSCLSTLPAGTKIKVVAKTDNGWYKSSSGYYVKASLTQSSAPSSGGGSSSGGSSSGGSSGSTVRGDKSGDFATYVKSFIGCKYVYGGSSPSSGFDCSGLVMYCYQNYYGISLPHGATSQSKKGREVSRDDIQVGDIICFDRNGDGTMEHSAIYVGNDTYVHAKGAAYGVVSDKFSTATGVAHIRRVR